ncbi:MAG: TetR/AcrR family transcriptional regulator [Maricaulis sp.]|jgi:AcrR family transcriptional regulator|nr:TetR/AcrR family transcriptional regulator [Maricaulis sp.]MDG2043320.1 TetR/AcrR family transcriptional regulator [Maricaulis sp.]
MAEGVKPATQKRSRETRDKLVRALEVELRSRAFDQISVADIAKQAGLSVGSVYRRFENKDAFIPVIFEIYQARLMEFNSNPETQVRVEPEFGLRQALHTIARSGWEFLVPEAHIIRAAHLYGRLRPDLIGDEWDALLEASVEGYMKALEEFSDEIKRPINRETAELVTYVFSSIYVEKGLYPKDGPGAIVSIDGDKFAIEMAEFIYGYLVTEPAS